MISELCSQYSSWRANRRTDSSVSQKRASSIHHYMVWTEVTLVTSSCKIVETPNQKQLFFLRNLWDIENTLPSPFPTPLPTPLPTPHPTRHPPLLALQSCLSKFWVWCCTASNFDTSVREAEDHGNIIKAQMTFSVLNIFASGCSLKPKLYEWVFLLSWSWLSI